MNEENWRQIEGFEGLYDVSDQGRVYSYYFNKILSPGKSNTGYYKVILIKNQKQFTKRINRLVAQHFIPNPEGYPEVHHKNEDKLDNRVSNLEWVSGQYNIEYSRAGYYVLYDPSDEPIEIYNLNKFARQNNLSQAGLFAVVYGKETSYYGYTREKGTKSKRNGTFKLISPDKEIFTFNCKQEAANYINCARKSVYDLLKGNIKTCKGWRRLDEH